MTKCPKCGAPMESGTCDYCGFVQQSEETQKDASNKRVAAAVITQVFVNNQAATNRDNSSLVSAKSRWLALAICYLLGLFGVHYFYVGKTSKGILYLCTLGLFGIGWIVDIVRIAMGKFTDSQNLPLKK